MDPSYWIFDEVKRLPSGLWDSLRKLFVGGKMGNARVSIETYGGSYGGDILYLNDVESTNEKLISIELDDVGEIVHVQIDDLMEALNLLGLIKEAKAKDFLAIEEGDPPNWVAMVNYIKGLDMPEDYKRAAVYALQNISGKIG